MNKRDKNFIKQIKSSFIFKFLGMIISFILLRLMIDYLGVEKFGVWSVILSFINWILFFDLGIANGLKNKIAESLALNKKNEAKEFISTGYLVLTFFSTLIYLLFLVISNYVNWQSVFNIYTIENEMLINVLRITLFFVLLNFVLSVITAVFNAIQKASLIVVNQFTTNLIALLAILLLNKFTSSNLLYLSFAYGFTLVLSNFTITLWFFKRQLDLSPRIKLFDIYKVKSISVLGLKFFLLQMTIFFIVTTDKFIITQLMGPEIVTKYDVLYKYIGAILILHGIINNPLWSIYTEAYVKNDHVWIAKTLKKMVKLNVLYIIPIIIMIISSNFIMKIWINNDAIKISLSNYIYMSIMILLLAWHSIFAYFSNGIGKIKIQFYTTIIGAIINIPLSFVFVKHFHMGIDGVLLATIFSLSIFGIFGPIQAFKEIRIMRFKL